MVIYVFDYFIFIGNLLGRYCGNIIFDSVDIFSNVVLVRFVIDGFFIVLGFRLRFEFSREGKFIDLLKNVCYWVFILDRYMLVISVIVVGKK